MSSCFGHDDGGATGELAGQQEVEQGVEVVGLVGLQAAALAQVLEEEAVERFAQVGGGAESVAEFNERLRQELRVGGGEGGLHRFTVQVTW